MGSQSLRGELSERTYRARSSAERMPSRQTGERTGSRPSAAEGGGASRASLEAGRSTVYLNTVALMSEGATPTQDSGVIAPLKRSRFAAPVFWRFSGDGPQAAESGAAASQQLCGAEQPWIVSPAAALTHSGRQPITRGGSCAVAFDRGAQRVVSFWPLAPIPGIQFRRARKELSYVRYPDLLPCHGATGANGPRYRDSDFRKPSPTSKSPPNARAVERCIAGDQGTLGLQSLATQRATRSRRLTRPEF
jgi:hypothetical protein